MPLEPGLTHATERVVALSDTAQHIGSGSIAVLGTPIMILWMEETALAAAQLWLEEGQTTVGTRVDVQHLAATPLGGRVRVQAELLEVKGRRLVWRVTADDEHERVGEGSHERYIIDVARFKEKLAAKERGA